MSYIALTIFLVGNLAVGCDDQAQWRSHCVFGHFLLQVWQLARKTSVRAEHIE